MLLQSASFILLLFIVGLFVDFLLSYNEQNCFLILNIFWLAGAWAALSKIHLCAKRGLRT